MSSDFGGEEPAFAGSRYLKAKQEIDSWRPFADALREEDRLVFREMMNSVSASYAEAMERAERGYDTESLLMSLVLNQQKTIGWLSDLARRLRDEEKKTA